MKVEHRRKAFVLAGLALILVGGGSVWRWLHSLEQRVELPQGVSVGKWPPPTADNPTAAASSAARKIPENTISDPESLSGAAWPELAANQNPSTGSKPALLQLSDLLAAARHGMARARFDELFGRWLSTLDNGEMLAALASLAAADLEESFFAELSARLVRRLAEADVSLASSAINAMPAGAARVLASENLAVVWADEQLPAALNWADRLPTGPEREADLLAVASEAVRTQPAEALRLADELSPGAARDELVSRAISEWAVTDPAAAISWSESITDDTLREQALASATTAWSDRDPAAAGAFALAELSPGRIQDDTVVGVAQRWAQQSPAAAAAWVQSLPESGLKAAAASNVASIWQRSDAAASKQWLAQIIGP